VGGRGGIVRTMQGLPPFPVLWMGLWMVSADPACGQAPLSAIDWLNDLPAETGTAGLPLTLPDTDRAEAAAGPITVRPLESPNQDSVGLYPASRVGLPAAIWGPTGADVLAELVGLLPVDTLPALRDLGYRLLLAEFVPPPPGRWPGEQVAERFLLARIDALVRFGALDQAGALLDSVPAGSSELQARRFDIRLLLGDDEAACADLTRASRPADTTTHPAWEPDPGEARLLPARIFCQARGGDWTGAESRLAGTETGVPYAELLGRFLDIDTHELTEPDLGLPGSVPSPLAWRLREALGEPVITQGLPLAYAHADLRGTAGWRAQIEAAERLVISGALPPNRLLGLYTERQPAASGGIWERVSRVQRLDAALASGEAERIGPALLAAWPLAADAELETAFAALFAGPLMGAGLSGRAREVALALGLLSDDYELAALAIDPGTAPASLRRLAAVARGLPPDLPAEDGADAESAVLAVFAAPDELPEAQRMRLAEGRIGEELLRALIRMGASNDPRMLAEGLTLLRALGLEDIARRAALQALMLERRG